MQQFHFENRHYKQAKSKLLSTELDCQKSEENLIAYERTYSKHLGDQIVLERLQTFIKRYWSKLNAGCMTFAYPIPIAKPSNFVKKIVIYVQDCPICNENFHCNDICVALCGHCYHLWCLTIQSTSVTKCQMKGCDQDLIHLGGYHLGFSAKFKRRQIHPCGRKQHYLHGFLVLTFIGFASSLVPSLNL